MSRSLFIGRLLVLLIPFAFLSCGLYYRHDRYVEAHKFYENKCEPVPFSPIAHEDRFYIPKPVPLKPGLVTHSQELVDKIAVRNAQKHLKLYMGGYTHQWWADLQMWTETATELLSSELEKRGVAVTEDSPKTLDLAVTCSKLIWQFRDVKCLIDLKVLTGSGDTHNFREMFKSQDLYGSCDGALTEAIASLLNDKGIVTYLAAVDTDRDGVHDEKDQCPDTPQGVKIDDKGCPKATDKDGEPAAYQAKCPAAPQGAKLDESGCWVIDGIFFEFDDDRIGNEYLHILDEIINILISNPSLKIKIEGHTDDVGTEAYNLALSKRRAESVMNYLIQKGISQVRLSTVGYGASRPKASNETALGQALNRRIEISPIY